MQEAPNQIAFQGYRIITGRSQQVMMALVGDSLKAFLVITVATGAAAGSSSIYWTLTDGASQAIVQAVTGSTDSPYADIDSNLTNMQLMFGAIDALSTGVGQTNDEIKDAKTTAECGNCGFSGSFTKTRIAGPSVVADSMLLLNKIAIAMFVGFGPIFIMCLLFEQTKSLFSRWLLYGIGTLFSLAVLSIMVGLATKIIDAVAIAFIAKYAAMMGLNMTIGNMNLGAAASATSSATEGITSMAMQQGGLGLILTTLIISAPPMAAAFFQGILGQVNFFSPFGRVGEGSGGSGYRAAAAAQGQVAPPVPNAASMGNVAPRTPPAASNNG